MYGIDGIGRRERGKVEARMRTENSNLVDLYHKEMEARDPAQTFWDVMPLVTDRMRSSCTSTLIFQQDAT